ncbi:MAG: TonB-dependent receptor, partial [Gammaproteobacteria bacterium]
GIERPQDFIALTPGVAQVQTAEVGDMQVNIRGINTGRDAETNFALVIDGVLQTNPNAFNRELSNVSQIEVLKGPQGALYGRNALAGAIILSTRKPGDEFAADLSVGVANKGTVKGNLYVSSPLGDNASGSLSAYHRRTDGFYYNSTLRCDNCSDYLEETGGSGRLLFSVGEGADFDVKAAYSKVSAGAINFNAAFALPGFAAAFGNPDFYQDVNDHVFKYMNNVKPVNEQKNTNLSIKGDFDVSLGTLTAIAAYNKQENYFLTDGTSAAFGLYTANSVCTASVRAAPAGPLPSPFFYANQFGPGVPGFDLLPPYGPTTCDGYQYQQRDQEDMSVELRLTSPGDAALRWQAGVYYGDIERRVVVSQGSDLNRGFLAQAFVPNGGLNPTDLLYDDTFDTKIAAVFGSLNYDLQDNLEVALALRYDREKRNVSNNVPRTSPQTTGFGAFGTPACPTLTGCTYYLNPAYNVPGVTAIADRSKTYSQLQPKLTVNWKLSDDVSFFGSYGYGFRSGGFNSQGSAATIAANYASLKYVDGAGTVTTTPSLAAVADDYKKEISKAAEAGFKATLFDRRLSVNGAIFYTKLEDAQFFNFFAGPFGLLRVVTNIDEVTLKGAEVDFRWKATDMFTLYGGIGTVDGKIDKYTGRPFTAGNKAPYAPEYTANLGAEFTYPVGDSMELVVRLDGTALGETWFHPVQGESVQTLFGAPGNYSKTKRDAYELFNARISLRADNWDATLWGRNLGDKDYLAEVIPAPEFGGSFIHAGTGRAYGLDLSYKFK